MNKSRNFGIVFLIFLFTCVLTNAQNKEQLNKGKAVYNRTCIACHQENGKGIPGAFPPLAKSDYLNDLKATIKAVKFGLKGPITVNGQKYNTEMVSPKLSDSEIADVLTFVYNNFGNNAQTISTEQVKAVK